MYSLREHIQNSGHFNHVPHKSEEAWRLADLHRYLDTAYPSASHDVDRRSLPDNNPNIEIIDNQAITVDLPESIHLKQTKKQLELNCFEDADLYIDIHYSKACYVESGLHILLQSGVRITLFISFSGAEGAFVSEKIGIKLEPDATLIQTQRVDLESTAVLILQTHVYQGEKSRLEHFSLLRHGEYLHSILDTDLHYKSNCHINALLLSEARQKNIFACKVRHLSDKAYSHILSKQVLKDESTCVFDARSTIEKGTKASEVLQASHALLLDTKAQIHSKPHLEIYSDDLTASHGSTVGELDEEALSYLCSRGIPKDKAKQMLIRAFVNESLEHISDTQHKNRILQTLGEAYV